MYKDLFYINSTQQKTLEDVIKYLIEQKQHKLVTPIIDIMRMSENWYGRLEELRAVTARQTNESD